MFYAFFRIIELLHFCLRAGITCPMIDTLENGQVFGSTYYVGDTVTFQCNSDNFMMYGPGNRTCLENWRWTGITTTCDDGSKFAVPNCSALNKT